MTRTLIRSLAALALAGATSLAVLPAATAATSVPVPANVSAALADFAGNPKGAVEAWTTWAAEQPMTTTMTNPGIDRTDCRIDTTGVSRCTSYEANPSGKKWNREGVVYTMANGKTQVIKSKGKWVRNDDGANNNPITNYNRRYSYDYWMPWTTPGVIYDASVGTDGWYTVQSQNPTAGDDQFPVLMVKISPDGTRAQFLQQYEDGKVAVTQTLALREVPRINVPRSTKQRM